MKTIVLFLSLTLTAQSAHALSIPACLNIIKSLVKKEYKPFKPFDLNKPETRPLPDSVEEKYMVLDQAFYDEYGVGLNDIYFSKLKPRHLKRLTEALFHLDFEKGIRESELKFLVEKFRALSVKGDKSRLYKESLDKVRLQGLVALAEKKGWLRDENFFTKLGNFYDTNLGQSLLFFIVNGHMSYWIGQSLMSMGTGAEMTSSIIPVPLFLPVFQYKKYGPEFLDAIKTGGMNKFTELYYERIDGKIDYKKLNEIVAIAYPFIAAGTLAAYLLFELEGEVEYSVTDSYEQRADVILRQETQCMAFEQYKISFPMVNKKKLEDHPEYLKAAESMFEVNDKICAEKLPSKQIVYCDMYYAYLFDNREEKIELMKEYHLDRILKCHAYIESDPEMYKKYLSSLNSSKIPGPNK